MTLKRTTEDYVKTVFILSRKGDVRCHQLATCLSVSRPTVSVTVKALCEAGLLYMDDKRALHLTGKGLELAQIVEERHQVLCDLLVGLGVDADIASNDACRLEHAISDESFRALKSLTQ